MNFFGHAVTATWRRQDAAFVLGSMLPDFASIISARLSTVDDQNTSAGVAWHHETDAAFHRLEVFRDLSRQLTARLEDRGLGRGGALAAGHVGVELILDGLLLESAAHRAAEALYLGAIELADTEELGIRFTERQKAEQPPPARFAELTEFLTDRGLPLGYRDPHTVAERLRRVVAHRPRLAIAAEHQLALTDELGRIKVELDARLGELLTTLRAQLEAAKPDGAGAAENQRAPSHS